MYNCEWTTVDPVSLGGILSMDVRVERFQRIFGSVSLNIFVPFDINLHMRIDT